ncbi:cupin domain-containing protein [Prauserella aidingensis]|uniref:cupin domain-containing protein n=1 Tax=Prauserella aidingensis TaxID=387890 RepID=UPI0020A3F729|nr:cupin domain-containing protein [Prauserella aidingensis]
MEYIRPFDSVHAIDTGFSGYRAQVLSHLESAVMIASHIEEGGCGPDLHYHRSDQLYYLMRGSMNIRLGDDVHAIEAGTLVFIPAGLAHCNWNIGPGAETHFEMIIPAPSPLGAIAIPVDSPDAVPAADRTIRGGDIRPVDPARFGEPIPGFTIQPLADLSTGSVHTVVNYAEVAPGKGGPATHVHDFDQYYLVLEGELTVEVALQKHVVGPETLVVLPAGVPHRQYNDGNTVEKHLAILSPAPEEGRPWDEGVTLTTTGENHSGDLHSAARSPEPAGDR